MPPTDDDARELVAEIVESTWGDIMVVPCIYPGAYGETWDVPLGIACQEHSRTVYYCHDASVLWCDGGPPDYRDHGFRLAPQPPLPRDSLDTRA